MKIAFLSDIHANIFALEAVYEDLEKEGVKKIYVAGDLIGYYYWPKEVLSLLMNDVRVSCIRGNHEEILRQTMLSDSDRERYKSKYGSGYDVCRKSLSPDEMKWLLSLPEKLEVAIDGCTIFISHGDLNGMFKYLYPDANSGDIAKNYSQQRVTVFGHTHHAFLHSLENRILMNPGSVGQPRDIAGLASYAVYDTKNHVTRFKRCQFNVDGVIEECMKIDPDLQYLQSILKK